MKALATSRKDALGGTCVPARMRRVRQRRFAELLCELGSSELVRASSVASLLFPQMALSAAPRARSAPEWTDEALIFCFCCASTGVDSFGGAWIGVDFFVSG